MSLRLRVWFFAIAIALSAQSVLTQRAGSIDTIAPAAARPGDSVTITGRGFGAINVRITVGGVPAVVLAANGNRVTFVVPAGVPQGATTVTAINPGGQSGSIAFQIIEGVLLAGTPSSLAVDATVDLREIGVDPSLIDHHVILTRLDVRLAPDATVGQINAALIRVGGGIVSMSQHEAMMTISVPRQPSIAALQTLADTLSGTPGILIALVGRTLQSQVLPASSSALREEHTLPTRFPAAWNVMSLAARNCETRRVPVLVADAFIQPEPNSHVGFDVQIPVFDYAPLAAVGTETHGYDVTTTLGALFDDHILTGANPLANCLSIHGVEVDGVTMGEVIDRVVDHLPNERFIMSAILAEGYQPRKGESLLAPSSVRASPGYFETMRAKLVAGRFFTDRDAKGAPRVIIVDDRLARRFWPNQNPIGRRMYRPGDANGDPTAITAKTEFFTVVGVIAEMKQRSLTDGDKAVGAYYFPLAQQPSDGLTFAMRSNGDPTSLSGVLRREIAAIDPQLPVFDMQPMSHWIDRSLADRRAPALLSIAFGLVALFLSAIGIYGVLAYLVTQRTKEIGIRVALGSSASAVFRLVLREGVLLVGIGLVLGGIGSFLLRRTLEGLLFGVSASDPTVLLLVSGGLAAVALAACCVPARRATRIDPLVALTE